MQLESRPHDPRGSPSHAPFVGRQAELAVLSAHWERAKAGWPCVVAQDGPAGIGKTTLVRRFLEGVHEAHVVRAGGDESEKSLSFGVLHQLMRPGPADWPESSSPPAAGQDDAIPDPLTAGAALVHLLSELQRSGPVVLVVDDLQWVDRPSLLAITFALRRLRVDHVLAVLTARDVEDPSLPEAIRRLVSDGQAVRLSLDGLTDDELRQLSKLVGTGRLSARAAARLRALTGGNPLYARALMEHVSVAALDDLSVPLPAPPSYAALVQGRLTACHPDAQALVSAASVLGGSCALYEAGALASVAEPLSALDEAIHAGLLLEDPGGGSIRFPHPLVHAAVYQQLGSVRRVELHTLAAERAEDESAMLRHRAAAATGPDAVLAGDLARRGRLEADRGSWAAAETHLTAAARLMPRRATRERLMLEAVECQLLSEAVADPDDLAVRLQAMPPSPMRNYLVARLELVTGRLAEAEGRLRDAWEQCEQIVDPTVAARVAAQLATVCLLRARGQEASDWADTALRLAPQRSQADILPMVRLAGQGICGRAQSALAALPEAPEPSTGSVGGLHVLLGRGLLRSWTDDLVGACQDLGGVLRASRGRNAGLRLMAADILAAAEYRRGRWDDAALHNNIALSIAADVEQSWLAPFCHSNAVLLAASRGDWERASAHAEVAQEIADTSGNVLAAGYAAAAIAYLAHVRGQPEQVIAALDPLSRLEDRAGIQEPSAIYWHSLLVDALITVGQLERARSLLESSELCAQERRRESALAMLARSRGNLAAARDDAATAAQAFDAAVKLAVGVDMPFERAVTHLSYGAHLRRSGKRRDAGAQLEAAETVFRRLRAHPYLERCQRELAACGRTPAPARVGDTARLTPQEFAVAHLVAQGLTNQQTARELVLSVKTVEYHLGHVFTKLQVSSRDRLAERLSHPEANPGSVPEATRAAHS